VPSIRCPSCSASVPAGAPWCTLCYVDLRPRTATALLDRPVPEGVHEPANGQDEPGQVDAAPEGTASGLACPACAAPVPVGADLRCPVCGTALLADDLAVDRIRLPLIGDPRAMSRAARLAVILVGSSVVSGVLLLISLVVH
jgi:hypothetical protein